TIKLFMRTLTKTQCRRLRLKLGGLNLHQIALFEKADYKTIKECFSQIQKKFQTFFKNTPQK
ncbi:MAG: hypothetical protein IKA39_05200, partial [Clostridia bacterium]|nr:hypothetical protein [Clostridia bacterium]